MTSLSPDAAMAAAKNRNVGSSRHRVKVGLLLLVFSFLLVFPGVPVAISLFGARGGVIVYAVSWVPFLAGIVIGGTAALKEFKEHRGRLIQAVKNIFRQNPS